METLFDIVNALETRHEEARYEDYLAWCDSNGFDAAPMRHHRHQISAVEQKWVVLDAMRRQIADDPEADTVSSEHILHALEDGAFAPSFEWVVEPLCENVLASYQDRAPAPN
jgi:hypothetical protein